MAAVSVKRSIVGSLNKHFILNGNVSRINITVMILPLLMRSISSKVYHLFLFQFIIQWKDKFALSAWCENVRNREKKKLWRRKDRKATDAFQYPWKEISQEK